MSTSKLFEKATVVFVVLSAITGPALAQFTPSVAVPAPLVGAGLPGIVVLGGVYGAIWLSRKLRNRR
jgi:hypothetical protein